MLRCFLLLAWSAAAEPQPSDPSRAAFPAAFMVLEAHSEPYLPATLWNSRGVRARVARVEVHAPLAKLLGRPHAPRLAAALEKLDAAHRAEAGAGGFFSGLEAPRDTLLPRPNGASALELVGIPLPGPGLYAAELHDPSSGSGARAVALVTNLAVHLKRGARSSLVWVTSLDRGEPVASAGVALADCRGRVLWQGLTDASGLALAAHGEPGRCDGRLVAKEGLAAAVWKGEDFSLALEGWPAGGEPPAPPSPEPPLEGPSRVLTEPEDGPLALAALAVSSAPLTWKRQLDAGFDERGRDISSQNSATVATATLAEFCIELSSAALVSVLAPTDVPRFIGAATAYVETAWLTRASAAAEGSGVLELRLATSAFSAPGFAGFAFANGPFGVEPSSGPGSSRFELPAATEAASSSAFPLPAPPDRTLRLEAALEVSAASEAARLRLDASAAVLPSARLVGLRLRKGAAFTVAVVDPAGSPAAGAPFKVELLTPPAGPRSRSLACAGVTDRRGRRSCPPPAAEGILEAVTEDDEGRASYAHLRFSPSPPQHGAGHPNMVPGSMLRSGAAGEEEVEVELDVEPRVFSPGETALVELPARWPDSYVLVTVERGDVLDAFVQRASSRKPRVRVPVRDRHAPSATVGVLAVHGRLPAARPAAGADLGRPRYRRGSVELRVSGTGETSPSGAVRTATVLDAVLGRRRFGRLDPALPDELRRHQ